MLHSDPKYAIKWQAWETYFFEELINLMELAANLKQYSVNSENYLMLRNKAIKD